MHPEALEAVRRMVNVSGYIKCDRRLGAPELIGLDLGGADVNGTARKIVPFVERWYGSDIEPGPGVDIVCDATEPILAVDRGRFSVVLCTELLEHVEDWPAVVRNIWSWLAPGGYAFLTFAGCSRMAGWGRRPHGARGGMHPEPGEYYGNVEHEDFYQVLSETTGDSAYEVWTRPVPGDIYAWFRK
jgi:SAM-dependent methyltransferase